jgi:hypothetical protein
MPDVRLLDPASEDYRIVAGLIRSAHEAVGAPENQWWNGNVGVLATTSRTRSRADLDGTIQVHPRHVIAPLHRAIGGGHDRWWNPKATRDAAYSVIYEGLRMAGPTGLEPKVNQPLDQPLDRALPAGDRSLDRALNEQLTYEITEAVMAANGLGDAYQADAPETALGGHGLSAGLLTSSVFRLNQVSTAPTAAARGLVDGLADATARPRQLVFNTLVQSVKTDRFGLAVTVVAETQQRGVLAAIEARGLEIDVTGVHRAAGREWARLSSMRVHTISTIEAAEKWGYAIGQDTAGVLVTAGNGLAELGSSTPEQDVVAEQPIARELTPDEVLGPQASPTGTPSTAGSAPAQRTGAERSGNQVVR